MEIVISTKYIFTGFARKTAEFYDDIAIEIIKERNYSIKCVENYKPIKNIKIKQLYKRRNNISKSGKLGRKANKNKKGK